MAKRALLIIDMLNDFMNSKGALYCGDEGREIIPAVRSLVDRFASEKSPIIYLRDAHDESDKEFARYAPHAVKGTWGSEIIPELCPPDGSHVVDKTTLSSFYKTGLEELLVSLGLEEVWLTGVVTSICIMDAAGDLCNRGYSVILPREAVADFDPEFQAFALKRMERVYGVKIVEKI